MKTLTRASLIAVSLLGAAAAAHEIEAERGGADAAFDVVRVQVSAEAHWLEFRMQVAGAAGTRRPQPAGALGGAPVHSYVWPTASTPRRWASARSRASWPWR